MTEVRVRPARLSDAAAAAALMRSSITALCAADHGDRADAIVGWTANKTPETVAGWIAEGRGRAFVAEIGGAMAAFGSVSEDGEVLLNYVHPSSGSGARAGPFCTGWRRRWRGAARGRDV